MSNSTHAEIVNAWRRLQAEWSALEEVWHDAAHDAFAHNYWEPYQQSIPSALDELQRLSQMLQKVKRDRSS